MADTQAQESPKADSKPTLDPKRLKAHIAALSGTKELGLDTASAALFLSYLAVDKGEKAVSDMKPAEVVDAAKGFGHQNPIAYNAIAKGHPIGLVQGLERYGAKHESPEEYSRIAQGLTAAAGA